MWTADCIATSSGVPPASVPPLSTYSPSEFSRTTTRSIGRSLRNGPCTPRKVWAGPNVGIKAKRLTQLDQRRERDAIGQPRGPTECSQKDRVKASQRGQEILRGHPSVTIVVGHAPVKALAVEMKPADNTLGSLDHLERGLQDFRPNSVTWVKCDSIDVHKRSFSDCRFPSARTIFTFNDMNIRKILDTRS